MKLTKIGLAVSLMAGMSFANASDFSIGVQTGVGFGGDQIIKSGTNTSTIESGDNFSFGVFVNTPVLFSDVYGKIAINFATESETYLDAEESFDRIPIDFLLMKRTEKYAFGAGLTYHASPSYEITFNDNTNHKADYDGALGLVLEAQRVLSNGIELGLRYTNIKYKKADISGTDTLLTLNDSVDGSNFALTAGYTF
jgi:opacity protein-like surface antigen